MTLPNQLTLLRLAFVPLLVVLYPLPWAWARHACVVVFVLGAVTDWLDGFLARRLNQGTQIGAFLDPVADKLLVAAALVMLAADPHVTRSVLSLPVFSAVVMVIIGREIAVSALREWMAAVGDRAHVAVSWVGKFKTAAQMVAITFLLWREPLWSVDMLRLGELLLYLAGGLTLWSAAEYLRAAWPSLRGSRSSGRGGGAP